MTATEFSAQHGDPTSWTAADIETQQNLAACDALPEATRMWLHMAHTFSTAAEKNRAAHRTAA